MFTKDEKFEEILLKSSKLDKKEIEKAAQEAKKNKTSLTDILLSNKLLADDHLGQMIAESI